MSEYLKEIVFLLLTLSIPLGWVVCRYIDGKADEANAAADKHSADAEWLRNQINSQDFRDDMELYDKHVVSADYILSRWVEEEDQEQT